MYYIHIPPLTKQITKGTTQYQFVDFTSCISDITTKTGHRINLLKFNTRSKTDLLHNHILLQLIVMSFGVFKTITVL